MKKQLYEVIQAIKERVRKGESTTFAERNVVNIYQTRQMKKRKRELLAARTDLKTRAKTVQDAKHNHI